MVAYIGKTPHPAFKKTPTCPLPIIFGLLGLWKQPSYFQSTRFLEKKGAFNIYRKWVPLEEVDTISKPLSECICVQWLHHTQFWILIGCPACFIIEACLLLFPDCSDNWVWRTLCTHALNTGEGRLGDGTHSHSVSQCSGSIDILSTEEATGYIYTRDYLGARPF